MNRVEANLSAIFLTKSKSANYEITLTFVMGIHADNELVEDMIIIVQDFLDVITYDPYGKIQVNYDYNVLFSIPPKEDIVCCLFAWHGRYNEYIPINFFAYALEKDNTILNRLRATLQQLLVNRIVPTTRIVRALYSANEKSLELSCVYYSSDNGMQLRLLKEMAQISQSMLPNMIAKTNIISLPFDEDIELCPLYEIRKGEWALFA